MSSKFVLFFITLVVISVSFIDAQGAGNITYKMGLAILDVNYSKNDEMDASVSVLNGPEEAKVDLYCALLTPGNALVFFPDWSTNINKISNITLPPNFYLPEQVVFKFNLPSDLPPINTTGNYTMAVGLADAGTMNFRSIDTASFHYTNDTGQNEKYANLSIAYYRDYSYDPALEYLYATAIFGLYKPGTTPKNYNGNDVDLGQCIFTDKQWDNNNPPGQGDYISGLDAGDKILVTGSPNGDFYMIRTPTTDTGYYYTPDRVLNGSDYGYDYVYGFKGSGGPDVGSWSEFSRSFPQKWHVTNPVLKRSTVIDTKKDLNIEWTYSQGNPYYVVVSLTSVASDYTKGTQRQTTCIGRFPDTGSATIPADKLTGLMTPDTPFYSYSLFTFTKINYDNPIIGGIPGFVGVTEGEQSQVAVK